MAEKKTILQNQNPTPISQQNESNNNEPTTTPVAIRSPVGCFRQKSDGKCFSVDKKIYARIINQNEMLVLEEAQIKMNKTSRD